VKIELHHINIVTNDVSGLDSFYRDVLGMAAETTMARPALAGGVTTDVAFVTDGSTQFHLAERDLTFAFRAQQAINPLERGHLAFRTDDIAAFKKRLEARGIPYSDIGKFAVKGWQQIFFHDPAGTIIEVHQVDE
jgi:glyoxylase I family protein